MMGIRGFRGKGADRETALRYLEECSCQRDLVWHLLKGGLMTVSPQGLSVQTLYRYYRDDALVVNRQYQRKLVWTVAEKQALIDSVLKDYPLPLFLLAERVDASGKSFFEIIDGMQRLNAIFSFIEHRFLVREQCFDLTEFARARQTAEAGEFIPFPDDVPRLSARDCANLLDYQLAVTIFPGQSADSITEVFNRINSGGKQLSDQERRQAGILSTFAEMVRQVAAEIRGDVSKETLLLSDMPEISIETGRNPHGYGLKAEDIFWCFQGVLRTGDLRESDDEQMLADIAASVLFGAPVEASGDFLDKLYDPASDEYRDFNARLAAYGRERLVFEITTTFSLLRAAIEAYSSERFAFRTLVYPKPTSNAQKSPFFAVFMAFHHLIFVEGMTPSDNSGLMKSLNDLTNRIQVGQKHIKTEDRRENVNVVNGLIRDKFTKNDVAALRHGPGLIFDFENSLRRSRTETTRYELKQGILRLDNNRDVDKDFLTALMQTIVAISNVGPDADGFVFLGVADNETTAKRIVVLDQIQAVQFEHVTIVGVDREARRSKLGFDKYMRIVEDAAANSGMSEPLLTQVLSSMDVIVYRGVSVVRIRVPKQTAPSFLADRCYIRKGSATHLATAPEIAAVARLF